MRAEWAQTRARMCRWKEELMIVQEEMQRVLAFFQWKASWWLDQASHRETTHPSVQCGLSAYAHKQAAIYLHMATRFALYWLPVLQKHGIDPEWSAEYLKTLEEEVKIGRQLVVGEESGDDSDDDNTGDVDLYGVSDA